MDASKPVRSRRAVESSMRMMVWSTQLCVRTARGRPEQAEDIFGQVPDKMNDATVDGEIGRWIIQHVTPASDKPPPSDD